MIGEQEARQAAERLIGKDRPHEDYWSQEDHDEYALAVFVRGELARREAERVEREKPIDAEWCVANEAVNVDGCSMFRWTVKVVRVDWDEYNGTTIDESDCNWVFLPSIKTRGQLFDLLAALKGGAT